MNKPIEYIDFIDKKYKEAKAKKLSRFSIEWGKWSRAMNLETKKRIESGKDPDEIKLQYVFIYWTLRSRLLEAHKVSRFGSGKAKRRVILNEIDEIREVIKDEDKDLERLSKKDLIDRALQR